MLCCAVLCVLHFRILRWLTDEEDRVSAEGLPRISFLVVEMSRKQRSSVDRMSWEFVTVWFPTDES